MLSLGGHPPSQVVGLSVDRFMGARARRGRSGRELLSRGAAEAVEPLGWRSGEETGCAIELGPAWSTGSSAEEGEWPAAELGTGKHQEGGEDEEELFDVRHVEMN